MDDAITIEVNGERRRAASSTTVAELLAQLELPLDRIAVELNRDLLPRAGFGRPLSAGDRLEIVTFVGGG
jgi:thiamine biosynthesis protein ThiS